MKSILFVCTANICRSPMAMVIFRDMVAASGEQWTVSSAGTWAIEGYPMAQKTQWILEKMGHVPGDHRSRQVEKEMLSSYDLILTMEKGHKEALKVEFPDSADKVFLLSEMIGLIYDIPDPIGKTSQDFSDTYAEIRQILQLGLEKIQRLTSRDKKGVQ